MNLSDPIRNLPGIGEVYAKRLKKLKINTAEDLLHHFPSSYQDFSQTTKIGLAKTEERVTVKGKVLKIKNHYRTGRKSFQRAIIADETGLIQTTWFNQPFLINTIKEGIKISLSGKVNLFGSLKTMTSPEFEIIRSSPLIHTGRIISVYPETRGVSSKWLRSKIRVLLELFLVKEFLPQTVLDQENLLTYSEALQKIHFPLKKTDYLRARQRLAFNELLLPQIKAQISKTFWQSKKLALVIESKTPAISSFLKTIPFDLTSAQLRAVKNILADLGRKTPMNRLLCGDVGSGKTVVAVVAAYAVYKNRFKTLIMAPTEILANQHYQVFKKLLPEEVSIGLQTGVQKKIPQKPDILIGTHALLFNKKSFKNIGLVVIDEQHRFGVTQRSALIKNNSSLFPHVLTMTATPIPRSVALVLHGNLDLSFLDQMPPGRQPVKTWLVPVEKRTNAYSWIKKQIRQNQAQVFLVYPLIEESSHETMKDVRAATTEYQNLKEKVFPDFRLALIHGQIKPAQREKIIKNFFKRKIDILVATSIVEVGLDIPGATIMIIESANRFGLAQLHQLRGRIGRNQQQSYCLLFASQKLGQKGLRRLKILERIHLGVKLAKFDLKERGPGEIFGLAQHGFPEFKLAKLTDRLLLEKTKKWAKELAKHDSLFLELKKAAKKDKISQIEPN